MHTMVIGIAGGTGSGKTTLTKHLLRHFEGNVSVINHDNYYKAHPEMPFEERQALNYDHPDAFDTDMLVGHVKQLIAGQAIHCPLYDFSLHDRTAETKEIAPTRVVIVEGILIFAHPELRELMDIKIFVETDDDVRILRRIARDVKKRGRSLDSVMSQYLTTVKPMHEQYVRPARQFADIVVLDGGKNIVALEMITQRIQGHIEAK